MRGKQSILRPKKKYKGLKSTLRWIDKGMAEINDKNRYIRHSAQFSRGSNYRRKKRYKK